MSTEISAGPTLAQVAEGATGGPNITVGEGTGINIKSPPEAAFAGLAKAQYVSEVEMRTSMRELFTRLEPVPATQDGQAEVVPALVACTSMAMSQKRIADALEKIAEHLAPIAAAAQKQLNPLS
jgi:hypothetical protein